MCHRRSVIVTIAALLWLGADGAAQAQPVAPAWQEVGNQAYAKSCGACHQPTGAGVPGAFPPLAGHAPSVLAQPGGRAYLIRLVLYGLQGPITVNNKPYDGMMPAWGEALSDAELAGALNVALHSWGNDTALPPGFAPFTPDEIAAARNPPLTAEQVHALRQQAVPAAPAATAAALPLSFTQDQADRGRAVYRRNCQDCHGGHLNDGEFGGAPLTGGYFARHWGEGSVAGLYGYLRTKMPPDRPGKLNPQTYADLTAFLLASNGYRFGPDEMPADPDALQRMSMKRD